MLSRLFAAPLPYAARLGRRVIGSVRHIACLGTAGMFALVLVAMAGCQNETTGGLADSKNDSARATPNASQPAADKSEVKETPKQDSAKGDVAKLGPSEEKEHGAEVAKSDSKSDTDPLVTKSAKPIASDSTTKGGDAKSVGAADQGDAQAAGATTSDRSEGEKTLPFEYQKLLDESRKPVQSELPELPEGFKRLDPEQEVWLNAKEKQVLLGGRICFREGVLEMFACMRHSKEHESIVAVNAKSSMLHAALLAAGAEPGQPVIWDPDYRPASGPKISIDVIWVDGEKKKQQVRAQEMILNAKTNKPLELDWVFGGSGFWKDPEDNKEYYRGDGGDMICVSNFASATLDLPVESSNSNDFLLYRANPEKVPPLETRVYLLLKPQLPK